MLNYMKGKGSALMVFIIGLGSEKKSVEKLEQYPEVEKG